MDGKRYTNLSSELRRVFGEKVGKLALDGGFTCPNRDGRLGNRGYIYCGERGAGEFTHKKIPISEQIRFQTLDNYKKWGASKYIAYFQSFTNTYAPLDRLKELYDEALANPGIVGLAIATRPDCLPEDVLDYLEELNRRTYLWVELGLQTIHQDTASLIRRRYPLSAYDEAVEKLKERKLRTVTHLILGLPGETSEKILESVDHVAKTGTWGIKLHSLYIQRDTDLYGLYKKDPFPLMDKEDYVKLASEALTRLPEDMVVHRITGDGEKSLLYKPEWSADKLGVISSIDRYMKENNLKQGCRFKL